MKMFELQSAIIATAEDSYSREMSVVAQGRNDVIDDGFCRLSRSFLDRLEVPRP